MKEAEIERLAQDVIDAYEISTPPVDPLLIGKKEGIILLSGDYDGCFDGRIEYRKKEDQGKFYLFYTEERPYSRTEGRVRFSVAHELGHYYLPNHREYLLSGSHHNSHSGFISGKDVEHEADLFAASLLMPEFMYKGIVEKKGGKVCSLPELADLATNVFKTSLTSTAIQYVHFCFEPCCVVLSRDGRVLYSRASEDMKYRGYYWIKRGTPVPSPSVTRQVIEAPTKGESPRSEGSVDTDVWFEGRSTRALWEEVKVLGRTGLVLTLLSLE
jgi:hypothetical protein